MKIISEEAFSTQLSRVTSSKGLDKCKIIIHVKPGQSVDFKETHKYGQLCRPIFSTFGYGRVHELFRMTNDNNLEGMTLIRKESQ